MTRSGKLTWSTHEAALANTPRSLGRGLSVNITPAERAGRIVIGAAAVVAAVALLTTAGSTVAVVLEVLLALAGVDLIVTGALGHCPLYKKLGHVPRSLRSTR